MRSLIINALQELHDLWTGVTADRVITAQLSAAAAAEMRSSDAQDRKLSRFGGTVLSSSGVVRPPASKRLASSARWTLTIQVGHPTMGAHGFKAWNMTVFALQLLRAAVGRREIR